MTLEELLKESPEALKAVQDAIAKANDGQEDKTKHVRFADLSEGGYVSKDKFTGLENDLTSKNSELETANKLIEELRKGTKPDETLQNKIKEYEDQIKQLQAESVQNKLKYALKDALRDAKAVDADYLIYNGTIDGQVSSLGDLEAKSNLFAEFKAVKDGNVWYTGKNLYQATDTVGELISDIHLMLTDGDASQMTFLEKMK